MAEFPKTESNVLTFTDTLCDRLSGSAVFVNPPVSIAQLRDMRTNVQTEVARVVELKGEAEQATEQKKTHLGTLETNLKEVLSWAEVLVSFDDAELKTIGWGGKKPAEPTQLPNAPSELTILFEGDGTISMKWKRPAVITNCAPTYYLVERREQDAQGVFGTWQEEANCFEESADLASQPTGITLEYRVSAINLAGASVPSNTVSAVL